MDLSYYESAPTAYRFYDLALRFIRASGVSNILNHFKPAQGIIFALHRVRPFTKKAYQPNLSLEITPDFLDEAIAHLKLRGLKFVSLDEALIRLSNRESGDFAVMTFDDGYYDTVEFALPVLEKHNIPATIYVVPGYADRDISLWWVMLEDAIRICSSISFHDPKGQIRFSTSTPLQKCHAFRKIHSRILELPTHLSLPLMQNLAQQAKIDGLQNSGKHCLGWSEIENLARHPLITIGAHSLTHSLLAKCQPSQLRDEMVRSREIIQDHIKRPVRHFSYPNGTKDNAGPREFLMAKMLGFQSATTVRPSLIYREHGYDPTALPRVSLNGYFQSIKILETLMSGAPFLLKNFSTSAFLQGARRFRNPVSDAGFRLN